MHIGRIARRAGGAVALAGCLVLGGLMAPAAFAQGNDGTVKVDGAEFDAGLGNEPHPSCIFQIDFYSFDDGRVASVNFTGQSPTGKDTSLLDDTVDLDATVGGGNDLVGTEQYDLSPLVDQLGEPQDQQGYHITLTVEVPDGTHSTAYSKKKVFWVKCAPTTEAPTTEAPKTEAPTTEAPTTEAAAVPTEVPAGAGSAGGGGSAAGLLGLAVVAGGAVAGTAVIARRRFLHDS
jgi:hypothetical protein